MIYMPFPLKFRGLKKTRYGPTDGHTDRPSYRDAWTHLKTRGEKINIGPIGWGKSSGGPHPAWGLGPG